MDGFIGEIKWFAGTYAPANWQFCWGQLLNISDYQALFAIIGNRYGGDGRTTFALPDLRCRVPIGAGQGPGLTNRDLADYGGAEFETINQNELGSHTHIVNSQATTTTNLNGAGSGTISCTSADGNNNVPKSNIYANAPRGFNAFSTAATGTDKMSSDAISISANIKGDINVDVQSLCSAVGGANPHENMQPWLCLNLIICLIGIFPERE